MSLTRYAWLLALAPLAPLAAGCASQEIIVAAIDDPHDAGSDAPPPCAKNDDCGPNSYCERPCDAPFGECADRPGVCGKSEDPSCGCSGTSYWNDCLRRQAGDSKRGDQECPSSVAARCRGHSSDCPVTDSSCGLLLFGGDPCAPPPALGKCWVVPSSCDGVAPSQHFVQCGNPICVDACNAIQSEIPSYRSNMPCH